MFLLDYDETLKIVEMFVRKNFETLRYIAKTGGIFDEVIIDGVKYKIQIFYGSNELNRKIKERDYIVEFPNPLKILRKSIKRYVVFLAE